jgi:hypothetical protein
VTVISGDLGSLVDWFNEESCALFIYLAEARRMVSRTIGGLLLEFSVLLVVI